MNNFRLGIFWFLLSLLVSAFNDSVVKYLSAYMTAEAVTQYRFIFATLTMLPLFALRPSLFRTNRYVLHFIRGLILFAAMYLWCSALSIVKITSATVISFTIPIFVLIMAPIFLKERVSVHLWTATAVCFIGILLILEVGVADYSVGILKMLASAAMFASLDIINKRVVSHEPLIVMLFYSNIVTMLLSFIFFGMTQVSLTPQLIVLLVLLGVGANSILFCILKAFRYVNASLLSPFRYLELVITFCIGYLFFGELLHTQFIIGAFIIIATTLYIARYQRKS